MGVSNMSTTANELCANLSNEVQQELAEHQRVKTVPKGSKLVKYGLPAEQLIILNTGSAEVTVPAGGRKISLGIAGPGKVLGLRSIICGEVPEIDVTCREQCDITLLPRARFLQVLRRNPQMYFAVVKVLSADLNNAHGILRQKTGRAKTQGEHPRA